MASSAPIVLQDVPGPPGTSPASTAGSVSLMRTMVRAGLILGSFAISGLFTYFAVRGIDWGRFRSALAQSNYWWLIPSFAVLMGGIVLRAVRWRLLFPHDVRPPLAPTFRALLVGTFFNNVLPGRPGEAIRVVTLHQETGTPRPVALGTAVSERLYDVIVLLVTFFLAVPWLPHVNWLRRAGIFAAILTVGLMLLLGMLAKWNVRPILFVLRPFARVPGFSPERIERVAAGLVTGLAAMRQPRLALPALVVSFAAVFTIALSFWLVTLAIGLHVSFGAGLLVMVATNLAMVIPSSPAAIGVFEAATVVALRPYGIDQTHALSFAVILHALNVVPFIVLGLVILPRHGMHALRKPR